MNTAQVVINVTPKDKPETIGAFLNSLREKGIVGRVRGAAQAKSPDPEREHGPWENAWCEHEGCKQVRRTEGRNYEQQAFHNFQRFAPEATPKGLRAPKE